MTILEFVAYPKKAYGLKPGEIVRTPENDTLYRYIGYRKCLPAKAGEIPKKISKGKVLVFETGVPVLADLPNSKYSYLLTASSELGNGDFHYLNCKVKELDKLGNIPSQLWAFLRVWDRGNLMKAKLKIDKEHVTNLWELLQDYYSRK